MDPFEERLKSLRLRRPSAEFGKPETLAKEMDQRAVRHTFIERIHNMSWKAKAASLVALAASIMVAYLALTVATFAGAGIQNILFGVSARDPLTYGVVVALITVVSLVATLVPARRATRVDPMIALRAE